MGRSLHHTLPALLAALLLAACGGGGGGDDKTAVSSGGESQTETAASSTTAAELIASEPNAPTVTGNTATDGFNWFNFRRQQIGVQQLARNGRVDAAAQGHSDYQRVNNVITHEQTPGKPGFTGIELGDRLAAAGYEFSPSGGYAYGEVISSTFSTSGIEAAEDLIAAIYHRFVIFEPMFKEAGAGAATVTGGNTYFTTNFTANGLNTGLGSGKLVIYPYADQNNVARNFMSDNEEPDPVPDRNEVGYPISIHADIMGNVTVSEFSVRPRGGATLPVRLLSSAGDPQTPSSAAAIVPLSPLSPKTTYDVQFSGTVDQQPVSRSWSFTTR